MNKGLTTRKPDPEKWLNTRLGYKFEAPYAQSLVQVANRAREELGENLPRISSKRADVRRNYDLYVSAMSELVAQVEGTLSELKGLRDEFSAAYPGRMEQYENRLLELESRLANFKKEMRWKPSQLSGYKPKKVQSVANAEVASLSPRTVVPQRTRGQELEEIRGAESRVFSNASMQKQRESPATPERLEKWREGLVNQRSDVNKRISEVRTELREQTSGERRNELREEMRSLVEERSIVNSRIAEINIALRERKRRDDALDSLGIRQDLVSVAAELGKIPLPSLKLEEKNEIADRVIEVLEKNVKKIEEAQKNPRSEAYANELASLRSELEKNLEQFRKARRTWEG